MTSHTVFVYRLTNASKQLFSQLYGKVEKEVPKGKITKDICEEWRDASISIGVINEMNGSYVDYYP